MLTHTIKINWFYLKFNKTYQHLDDKRYKKIRVMIYLIFVKYMKQEYRLCKNFENMISVADLRTGATGAHPPFGRVIRKFQGTIVYSPIRRQKFLCRWTVSLKLSAFYIT